MRLWSVHNLSKLIICFATFSPSVELKFISIHCSTHSRAVKFCKVSSYRGKVRKVLLTVEQRCLSSQKMNTVAIGRVQQCFVSGSKNTTLEMKRKRDREKATAAGKNEPEFFLNGNKFAQFFPSFSALILLTCTKKLNSTELACFPINNVLPTDSRMVVLAVY